MRDIKFRFWYEPVNSKSEMISWKEVKYSEENLLSYLSEEGFISMQYTGLDDKNGKEIYEGDILKSVDEDFKETIYTIVWSKNRACFDMKNGYCIRVIFPISSMMEVIGNIYENPELLKEKLL